MRIGWPVAVTVVLASLTLALALKAAALWWRASRSLDLEEPTASITDAPELHVLTAQVELNALMASLPINRRAAFWTGWAAFAGAITSIWGALSTAF
ncbi:MAG: hypothetical protein WCA81_18640 [Rhizomicrobium sp.]